MASKFLRKLSVGLVHSEDPNCVYFTQVAAAVSGTALLHFVLLVSWWVSKSWNQLGGPPLPPGPLGLPLVGNLPFLEPDHHRFFTKLAKIYGPIMKLQLGPKLCVVLTSPSLAREALKDHDTIFANRDPPLVASTMTYGGIDIEWSLNGPQWRMMHSIFVHELMSNKILETCYSLRRQEVQKMVKEVFGKIGTFINICEVTYLTMLSLIMNMLWGDTLQGDEPRMMHSIFVHELMSNKILETCYSLRRQEVQKMVKEVFGKIGTFINICEVTYLTMLSLIMNMLWRDTLQGDEKTSICEEI
ncbi:costunolide synthase-like [Telopea speciosissima]|uniref:costunolide synthase-like n=1 Tax=Telopea speciosissima TaxID=54955 RepID=UPI001CC77CF7|nr:costunolide synthase-like [Telopea speciosissima]